MAKRIIVEIRRHIPGTPYQAGDHVALEPDELAELEARVRSLAVERGVSEAAYFERVKRR